MLSDSQFLYVLGKPIHLGTGLASAYHLWQYFSKSNTLFGSQSGQQETLFTSFDTVELLLSSIILDSIIYSKEMDLKCHI